MKQELYKSLLSENLSNHPAVEKAYIEPKATVYCELRRMKKNSGGTLFQQRFRAHMVEKNSKTMYSLFWKVFGPQASNVVPLKSKEGTSLTKDTVGITQRWCTRTFQTFFQSISGH